MTEKCERCGKISDRNFILKCPSCGKNSCAGCILKASSSGIACPGCKKPLIICPTCLKASTISRLKLDKLSCSKCGFKLK